MKLTMKMENIKMKVVINNSFAEFEVNGKCVKSLEIKGYEIGDFIENETFGINSDNEFMYRSHKDFIDTLEAIGLENASYYQNKLKIVEIPDDIEWTIQNEDGIEWIAEKHRTWR